MDGLWFYIALCLALALAAALVAAWRVNGHARQIGEARERMAADLAALRAEREATAAQSTDEATRLAALAAVFDALPIPVWRRRQSDLRLVAGNRAYGLAVDAAPEVAIAEQRELAAGAFGADGLSLAARARATGTAQRESRHIVIAGSRRLLEISESPLAGGDEIVGFARDFTDVETVEAQLTRHIEAHGEVLENITVAIAIYGPDTRLNFFNRAFAALWHLDSEWLASAPDIDAVLERLREHRRLPEHADFRAYKRQVQNLFTSLIAPQQELMHLPDERTLRLAVAPHPFGGLIFVYEDVTDRLALERSFNTLIEVQRETLDNLKEAVAVFGTDGRLKLWNPAFAAIWRIEPEALSGEPHIGDIMEKMRPLVERGSDWPSQRRQLISRLMTHGAAAEQIERNDGSILQFAAVPLPDGNMLLLYLDVTDTTRLATALSERNDALEAADRLKSEFIANVSYELRTPLNVILGFAELLTAQYFGALNPRQLEYSSGILESARILTALINDILDLASIQAGYLELELKPVDLGALLSSFEILWHEQTVSRRLKLRLDCPPDIGVVHLDPQRIKQALFALVSNSVRLTPPGGEIVVAARRTDDDIVLSVAGSGPVGAPANKSAASLGLSLVKSIVALHGGTVEFEAVPDDGTAALISLPIRGLAPAVSVAREMPVATD